MSHEKPVKIEKIVTLAAPVSRVWDALTDHRKFGEWFRVRLDAPFRVGETTTGQMTFPGHEHVQWVSVTEKLEPERLFVFSWPPSAVDPDGEYGPDAKIFVEFRLEAIETGTRLTIVERGFEHFPDSKRLEILHSNTEGWDIQARNISDYVENA